MTESTTPSMPTVAQTTVAHPPETENMGIPKKLWLVIVFLIMVFIILAGGAYFFYNQQQKQSENVSVMPKEGFTLPSSTPTPTVTPAITLSDSVSDIEKDLSGTTFEAETFFEFDADLQAL